MIVCRFPIHNVNNDDVVQFFEHEPPTDQTVMSRWRKRAGEAGVTDMTVETLEAVVRSTVAKAKNYNCRGGC